MFLLNGTYEILLTSKVTGFQGCWGWESVGGIKGFIFKNFQCFLKVRAVMRLARG